MLHPFGRTSNRVVLLTPHQTLNIIFLRWRWFWGVAIFVCPVPSINASSCGWHTVPTFHRQQWECEGHWYVRCDVINAIQVSTLIVSWCGDNSCGIQTPYFHVLPNSLRCVSTVLGEHPTPSAKQHVVSVGSSSMSCYKTSTFTSRGLAECRELSSSTLPPLNRLNQCCTVRIERMSTPVVPHIFLAASVASQPKWNSWNRSTRSSWHDKFICDSWSMSTSMMLLLFERCSNFPSIPLVLKLLELSRLFYGI